MSQPNDFTREHYESRPMIKVRYRGECRECGTAVQATATKTAESKEETVWVRCSDCGTINLCEKDGSCHADGAVAGDPS